MSVFSTADSHRNYIFLIAALFTFSTGLVCHAQSNKSVSAERTFITGDNIKLYVKVSGAGPPVLFIHGGPAQGSLSFEKMGGSNLESFATMIYLDQRGSGKSQNAENYHLDRIIEDIEEVRKSLGFDKIYLLAHSFGGIIAAGYAQKYSEHTSGLILAAATLYMNNPAATYDQIKYANQLLKKKTSINKNASREELSAALGKARSELSKQHLGYKFLTDDIKTIEKMSEIDDSYQRTFDFGKAVIENSKTYSEYYEDYAKITPSIKVPVLILTGTKDRAVGANHYRSFNFPEQTVKRIDGGHLFYYENNKSFTKMIFNFINSNPGRR